MRTKLTKRERVLVYIMIVVLVIFAGWLLIEPAMETAIELKDQASLVEHEKSSNEQTIAMRPIYADTIAQTEERIDALGESFLPLMTNDDLDRYITGLLQENGLVAESLRMTPAAEEAASASLVKLSVKVMATGELPQFMALVQQLSELDGIRLSRFTVLQRSLMDRHVPAAPVEATEPGEPLDPADAAEGEGAAEATPAQQTISVMLYGMELYFEVLEFDRSLMDSLVG
jgi:Tfp pilus assembly protein PilO